MSTALIERSANTAGIAVVTPRGDGPERAETRWTTKRTFAELHEGQARSTVPARTLVRVPLSKASKDLAARRRAADLRRKELERQRAALGDAPVMGLHEVAVYLGISKAAVVDRTYTRQGVRFPAPLAKLRCGTIWERSAIEEYERARHAAGPAAPYQWSTERWKRQTKNRT